LFSTRFAGTVTYKMKKIILPRRKFPVLAVIIICFLLLGSAGAWMGRHTIARLAQQAALPKAMPYEEKITPSATPQKASTALSTTPTTAPTKIPLPSEANLAVPFTVQAPHANWEDPYGELCEEASVLMAVSYLTKKEIPNADFADKALLAIKDFEDKKFGYYKDTTAEETAIIIREHFSYSKVEVKQNPTIDNIKQAIADGRVVIAPLAGREIGNPYFHAPGPLYHMLVIKGYTDDGKFITNDPGTKRGENYLYPQDRIMEAIHDWRTDQNIDLGKKVILIVG
jgi:hypothetical protein